MSNKKYIYNYDIEQCNQLFKLNVKPIGCGINKKTNSVYHVFYPNSYYFGMLDKLLQEDNIQLKNVENTSVLLLQQNNVA